MAQASIAAQAPTATNWVSLFNLYWTVAVIAGIITIGALIFFAVKYRMKAGSRAGAFQEGDRGSIKLVLIVILIMAVVLGAAAYSSFKTIALYDTPPTSSGSAGPVHINVEGSQFQWTFTINPGQPNERVVPGLLVVPENTVVILNITSRDVFHSFGIPDLKVKADAIPGRFNTLWFTAPAGISLLRIQCYELCGVGHASMVAHLSTCAQGTC